MALIQIAKNQLTINDHSFTIDDRFSFLEIGKFNYQRHISLRERHIAKCCNWNAKAYAMAHGYELVNENACHFPDLRGQLTFKSEKGMMQIPLRQFQQPFYETYVKIGYLQEQRPRDKELDDLVNQINYLNKDSLIGIVATPKHKVNLGEVPFTGLKLIASAEYEIQAKW